MLNGVQEMKMEAVTSLKSIMALAISFPKKRNFILILAMCAGLVVLPKGTANSPLELNMYLVPSWFPAKQEGGHWKLIQDTVTLNMNKNAFLVSSHIFLGKLIN